MSKKQLLQRAFLAFTTGLFLACAARMSASPEPVSAASFFGVGGN
jgi:hypothetical protein